MALRFDFTLDNHHIRPHCEVPAALNGLIAYRTFDASVLKCKRLSFCHDMLHLLRQVNYISKQVRNKKLWRGVSSKTNTKKMCRNNITRSILNGIRFHVVHIPYDVLTNWLLKQSVFLKCFYYNLSALFYYSCSMLLFENYELLSYWK